MLKNRFKDTIPDILDNQPPDSVIVYTIITIEIFIFGALYLYLFLKILPNLISGQKLSDSQGGIIFGLTYLSNTVIMFTLQKDGEYVVHNGTNIGYIESSSTLADIAGENGDENDGWLIVWLIPFSFIIISIWWLVIMRPKAFKYGEIAEAIEEHEKKLLKIQKQLESELFAHGNRPPFVETTLPNAWDTLEEAKNLYKNQKDGAIQTAERAVKIAEEESRATEYITDAWQSISEVAELGEFDVKADVGHNATYLEVAVNEANNLLKDSCKDLQKGEFGSSVDKAKQAKQRVTELPEGLVIEADKRVTEAKNRMKEDDYSTAVEKWEKSLDKYKKALEVALIFDQQTDSIQQRIDNVEQEYRITEIKSKIKYLENKLEKGDLSEAESGFKKIIGEIESLSIAHSVELREAREQAQRGHLDAQIKRGRQKHERAVQKFRDQDYYEARETFDDVQEFLKPVLSLASKYGFTDKKEEILRLDKLCEVNADEARHALYGTSTSDLSSIDEIKIEEDQATPPGGRPEDYDTPPIPGQTPESGSEDIDKLPNTFPELAELTNDKPEHEKDVELGSGRNSVVWKVKLIDSGEMAALKEVFPPGRDTMDIELVKQFLKSSKTWSERDDHPHIVSVKSFGFDAKPWLLVEYMPEGSLRQNIGELSVADGIEHIVNVADALVYTRDADHHDIKPDNILLDADHQAKLGDWETTKLAFRDEDSQTKISPPYAAPEQFKQGGEPLDAKTDIYQLGVTAYELLTGELPYDPKAPDFKQRVLAGEPRLPSDINPEIPAGVDRIVLQAMNADRGERYEKPIEFRNDLKAIQNTITSPE